MWQPALSRRLSACCAAYAAVSVAAASLRRAVRRLAAAPPLARACRRRTTPRAACAIRPPPPRFVAVTLWRSFGSSLSLSLPLSLCAASGASLRCCLRACKSWALPRAACAVPPPPPRCGTAHVAIPPTAPRLALPLTPRCVESLAPRESLEARGSPPRLEAPGERGERGRICYLKTKHGEC